MKNTAKNDRVISACILVAATSFPFASYAQGTGSSPAPAGQAPAQADQRGTVGLADIVVTAQKSAQNLQDVPLSVTAFNSEALSAAGINSAAELQRVDPSLTITMSASVAMPVLRGVGNTSGDIVGNESSVPLYIDDVYITRPSNAYLELANVERVEVLKGPQGTLFGRNASGGVINVFTREPDRSKMVAEITGGYGNYDTIMGKAYVSTPLGDRAAIDLSFSGKNQRNGWGNNIFNGHDVWKEKYASVRSKLVVDLSETTKLTAIGYWTDQTTDQGAVFQRSGDFVGFVPLGAPLPAIYPNSNQPLSQADNGGFYNINVAYDPYQRIKTWGTSLKIEQELGFADLVSISAYRHENDKLTAAGIITPNPFLGYDLYARERVFTQEVQLKSQKGSAFDWILGAYYLQSKAGFFPTQVFGDGICLQFGQPLGCVGNDLNNPNLAQGVYLELTGIQKTKSYSGFGQATFHVIPDTTNVTLGLRYTSDKLSGYGLQTFTIGGSTIPLPAAAVGPNPFRDSKSFSKLTYKVAVDHKLSERVMVYASYSRGYKSGVYNTLPLDGVPTRPEVVDAYEAGIKSEFFDRRVRVNAAIFRNDISDPQVKIVRTVNGVGSIVFINAGAARSQGIELSGQALLAPGLTFRFAGQYLDAKYRDFDNAPFYFQLPAPTYGLGVTTRSANGNRMPQAPEFKGNLGLNYQVDTGLGKVTIDNNVTYSTQSFFTPDNIFANKAFAMWDASIAIAPNFNENISFRLWGKNLTKRKYVTAIFENVGSNTATTAPASPRTYGMEATYKF